MRIVLIGDSIIAGYKQYPSVWSRLGKNAHNHGTKGAKSQNVIAKCLHEQFPLAVSDFLIQAGTNDINSVMTEEDISNNLLTAAKHLRDRYPAARISLLGILPRDCKNDKYFVKRKVRKLNVTLSIHCRKEGFKFIETSSAFELGRNIIWDKFLEDGLHLVK